MRQTTRIVVTAAALMMATPPAAAVADGPTGSGVTSGGGGTVMAFSQVSRRCDYSETDYNGPSGVGHPTAVLRSDGSTVSADVQLVRALPNFPYVARLIQLPRPSSAPCWGGDPGVVAATLHTDASGAGSVTLTDGIEPGATKAWIWITRPDAFSQNPAEFYTTDFAATI